MVPLWLQAGFWGLLSGSALIVGAAAGYYIKISRRMIAGIMPYGSGVLISALTFDLRDEADKSGGFDSTSIGFVTGALTYTIANIALVKKDAKHRKRSGNQQVSEPDKEGSGTAIAVRALLDGIPEFIVIGVSMIKGGTVGMVAVIAIFLSNIPECLSSASAMKNAGRSVTYIFSVWAGIAIISGFASLIGYAVFDSFSKEVIAATTAVAAGAILAMLSDTIIPEAFEEAHNYTGLIIVTGFFKCFHPKQTRSLTRNFAGEAAAHTMKGLLFSYSPSTITIDGH